MSIIGAALIAGVIGVVVPTGSGEGLKKHVNLIGALCVLCILIAPAGEALDFLSDLSNGGFDKWFEESREDYNSKYAEFMLSVGKDNVESGIAALLEENFGIPQSECRVDAVIGEQGGELEIISVRITLSGKSVLKDPYAIEKYIGELLDCKCNVY